MNIVEMENAPLAALRKIAEELKSPQLPTD